MMKRGVGVLFGVLIACLTASAYEARPIARGAFDAPIYLTICTTDILGSADTSDLVHGLPLLGLLNDVFASKSELGGLPFVPQEIFPVALIAPTALPARNNYVYLYDAKPAAKDAKDFSSGKDFHSQDMAAPISRVYYGGEVGFMYGASSGNALLKGDEFRTYGVFEVGDDKTHIVVGTSYEESSYKLQRGRLR